MRVRHSKLTSMGIRLERKFAGQVIVLAAQKVVFYGVIALTIQIIIILTSLGQDMIRTTSDIEILNKLLTP
jgi:hypothetical protein